MELWYKFATVFGVQLYLKFSHLCFFGMISSAVSFA